MPSRPSVAPPPCSSRAEPSKILFSLIEKIFWGRAQIQKCKEYFARRRASASGGGAVSFVQSRFGFRHIIAHKAFCAFRRRKIYWVWERENPCPRICDERSEEAMPSGNTFESLPAHIKNLKVKNQKSKLQVKTQNQTKNF